MVGRGRGKRNIIHTRTFPRLRTREAPSLFYRGVMSWIGELCYGTDIVVVGSSYSLSVFLLDVGSDARSGRW